MANPSDPPPTLLSLRWVEGQYGSYIGSVGSLKAPVATVGYDGISPHREAPSYYVRVDLPGFRNKRAASSLDAAKAIAAACVNSFIRKVCEEVPDVTDAI